MRSLFVVGMMLLSTLTPPPESHAHSIAHSTDDAQEQAATAALRSMFFESGLFENTISEFVENRLPETRTRVEQSAARAQLSERGRAALDRYIEELPSILSNELNIGMGELIELTAQRCAQIFSVTEWEGIANFFAEPSAQTFFVKLSRGDRSSVTEEEMDVAMRFFGTPAGQAYAARGEQLNTILATVMAEELPRITEGVAQRSFRRLCDALANECPADIRAQAGNPI